MAYGVKTPIVSIRFCYIIWEAGSRTEVCRIERQVDGNVHRLLCRLLALHAPTTSPALIKTLWASAQDLVDNLEDVPPGLAGDLNQVSPVA